MSIFKCFCSNIVNVYWVSFYKYENCFLYSKLSVKRMLKGLQLNTSPSYHFDINFIIVYS